MIESKNNSQTDEHSAKLQRVAEYYDQNTAMFRWFEPAETSTVHRLLWPPGVTTRAQAAEHVHHLISAQLKPTEGPLRLLDLGCGTGGTSFWFAQNRGASTCGISLSRKQVEQARRTAARLGLGTSCTFLQRSYLELLELGGDEQENEDPAHDSLRHFDVAVAIESFAHCTDAERFFLQARATLKPGGLLILCDDFLAAHAPSRDDARARTLRRLETGWHFHALATAADRIALARRCGLSLRTHTPLSHLQRLQPRALLSALEKMENTLTQALPVGKLGWVENMRGGTALQQAHHQGWLTYDLLVFENASTA